ncbi:MAG: hypothetical protein H7255_06985 [Ramlibacter sp.]|nr:hypothetical protein [Ramlibacter sp.]
MRGEGLIVGANRTGRLAIASVLLALCAVASLYRALAEPSLGWRFTTASSGEVVGLPMGSPVHPQLYGVTRILAGELGVAITPDVVIESAGIHNDYVAQDEFFAAQRTLWEIVHAPLVQVQHAGGITQVAPHARGINELGMRFWFPWAVALLSLSVGLAIWVYRPASSASWCYLAASAGYAFGMLCTSTWGSRLLTQPPQFWPQLHVASHIGSFMTQVGLCTLLWLHPRRLGGNWLPWSLAVITTLSAIAEIERWVPTISLAFRLPIVLTAVVLWIILLMQWRACRNDASQRAQLKWFALLLVMGLSSTFIAYAFGATGHVVNVPQNYGLGTVALIFLGLVPLVTRVGIFQLEAWWPRAWLWFLGGLLVIALDLVLIVTLDMGSENAIALSLALAGWLYFPLRQVVWRRLSQGALPDTRDVLPQILEIVTHGQSERAALNQKWRRLWDTLFQPSRMIAADTSEGSGIADEGRLLVVPGCGPLEALQLELPERGARLFNPADLRRATEISGLVKQGLESNEAFDRGAREERQRIASDLHDDLGAKLLTIAQTGGSERVAAMAREALDEMRLAVRGLTGAAALADNVFADWRAETVTRLGAGGVQAVWQAEDPPPGLTLSARTHVQLTRVLRESVSNVIRHSGARTCHVHIWCNAERIELEISDDGHGLRAAQPAGDHGNGLPGIERRVRLLDGAFTLSQAAIGGVSLRAGVPLAASTSREDNQ